MSTGISSTSWSMSRPVASIATFAWTPATWSTIGGRPGHADRRGRDDGRSDVEAARRRALDDVDRDPGSRLDRVERDADLGRLPADDLEPRVDRLDVDRHERRTAVRVDIPQVDRRLEAVGRCPGARVREREVADVRDLGQVVASRAVAGWLIASIGTVPGNSWTDCEIDEARRRAAWRARPPRLSVASCGRSMPTSRLTVGRWPWRRPGRHRPGGWPASRPALGSLEPATRDAAVTGPTGAARGRPPRARRRRDRTGRGRRSGRGATGPRGRAAARSGCGRSGPARRG